MEQGMVGPPNEPEDFEDGYEDYDEDFCDHDEYDADILSGRAQCYRCGEAWWLSDEQLRLEIRHASEYFECVAAEEDAALSEPLP